MLNSSTAKKPQRADQLQFLRFFAFLLIFMWHAVAYTPAWMPKINGATQAVSFFFILSGLVTSYSYYDKDISLSAKSVVYNIWGKIKKFYPLFLVTTIITIGYLGYPKLIVMGNWELLKTSGIQLIKNLFLIQSWFPKGYYSFNGVSWFLSTIVFLYLFNIPFMRLLKAIERSKAKFWIYGSIFAALMAGTVLYCYAIREKDLVFLGYVFPPARIGEYLGGMIMGYVVRILIPKIKESKLITVLFTALELGAIAFLIFALYRVVTVWQLRIAFWLLPNFLVLAVFSFGKGLVSRLFSIKPLKYLGDISFECFLIHQLILQIYQRVSGVGGNVSLVGNVFSIVFCLILTLLIAGFIHHGSTKPKKKALPQAA